VRRPAVSAMPGDLRRHGERFPWSLFGPVPLALLALAKLARNDLARYQPAAQRPGGRAHGAG
jgi:hypothetical protein